MGKKVLGLIVSFVIFYLVTENVSWEKVGNSLSTVSIKVLIISLLINIIGAVFFNSLQILQHIRMSRVGSTSLSFFLRILYVDFVIRFYSLLLPAAATAIVRWHMFAKLGVNVFLSGLLVLVNKILNLMFIFLFSFIAILLTGLYENSVFGVWFLVISFFGVIFFFALISLLNTKKGSVELARFGYLLYAIDSRFISNKRKRLFRLANEYKKNNLKVLEKRKDIVLLYLWPTLSFFLVAYSQLLIMQAMTIDVSFIEALFVRAVVLLVMMIPFSFAGIGFRELGVIGVLGLYGVSSEDALVVSLILFVFQLIISAFGFVLLLIAQVKQLKV